MQQKVALNHFRRHDYSGSCGGDFKVTSFQDVSMNLFSSIVRSVHKRTKYPRPSCRQSRPETVLSSERLEPRHYLSADGLVQDPAESWSVTYAGLTDGSQHPYTIGSGYSTSNLNQADVAMLADVVRTRYDVTGKGIKIGIISTSFNQLGGMQKDIELGVLPEMNETVGRGKMFNLQHDDGEATDEGRAMAQLVHSIAPGAELYFSSCYPFTDPAHTTPEKYIEQQKVFADRIKELVDLGCKVIVDDIYDPTEPWFQDGPVSLAVDNAVRERVAYFSIASNNSNFSYQSEFRGTSYSEISENSSFLLSLPEDMNKEQFLYHDFDPHAEKNILQRVSLLEPSHNRSPWNPKDTLVVQWDQPWGENNSANEIWFFDDNKQFLGKTSSAPKYSIGAYPLPGRSVPQLLPEIPSTFYIAFAHNKNGFTHNTNVNDGVDGTEEPTFLKWIIPFNGSQPPVGDDVSDPTLQSFIEYANYGSSTAWGHNNSKLAASVGAAQYWSTPAYHLNTSEGESVLSQFSSFGGTPILFDSDGQRKQEYEYRPQPHFIAPQNGDTSFFEGSDPDNDFLPNFPGTSAAAPNVAAVAALLLELNPELTPAEIYKHLADSAVNLSFNKKPEIPTPTLLHPTHFNYPTGAGLIQAKEAAARVADISIQGKVFEDFGRNGTQDLGDRPLEGMPVFLDSNGNGIRDSKTSSTKPGPSLIVDPATPYVVSISPTLYQTWHWPTKAGSVITFEGMAGTITDVALSYTIYAPEGVDPSGDPVFLTLISPLGIRVPITGTNLEGRSFNSYGQLRDPVTLARPEISTRFGGEQTILTETSSAEHMSLADLAAFKHTPANGSWSLEVMNANPNHSYILDNWSLTLTTEEHQVETDAQGTYEFHGSHLSFSSAVGAYTPMVELTDNQFITTNNKTAIGRRNLKPTVNIGVSLPRVERPELLPSTKIIVDNTVPGPNPFVFSWNNLATSLLPSVSGVRFVIASVHGTVEKKSGDTWVDISTPPQTSHPRELIRLLSLRIVKPNDELRWIPPAESPQAEEAFSLIGWNGKFASESKSSIRFEAL